MTETLLLAAVVALAVALVVALVVLLRGGSRGDGLERLAEQIDDANDAHAHTAERLERELRAEIVDGARHSRTELAGNFAQLQQTLAAQLTSVATVQNSQIDGFAQQLAKLVTGNTQQFDAMRDTLQRQAQLAREEQGAALRHFGDTLNQQLTQLTEANDRRIGEVRATLETRLKEIEANNAAKLEEMRRTVDEKLLEQMLTPDQYAKNVATVPKSSERVEFAIRLPGRHDEGAMGGAEPVWLPIDAKFPREDYERLIDAQERADAAAVEEAARALEARIRAEARTIAEKYVAPPHTTDFALLFLPTEGLYAEILRRPGLTDLLQRDYRVTVAGPTTLTALLNSLQMGFRTLAIEKRSSEVWQVLGAVKTEFGKFGDVLARTKSQLETVTRSIEAAEQRTRVMNRKLKQVEALPGEVANGLLGADGAETGES